jgi:hypothetical protein
VDVVFVLMTPDDIGHLFEQLVFLDRRSRTQ